MAELKGKPVKSKNNLKDFKISGEFNFNKPIDKILNLHFFRKLSGKTQVILSLAGPSVRTRLTHTVEVARIARTICDKLGLNSDLAEAIALAHDIGHTPFGHVGERALKEVMCGCDTLKGKINDIDFHNSGFKHNLQSFRVLSMLEAVSNSEAEWPYILWGVAAHSNMSWSKPNSGMDDEILISCKYCDRVYSCLYHEKKICKRNIQHKKKGSELNVRPICLPYFCAILGTYKTRHDRRIDKLVQPGENREDYIGWFTNVGRKKVYCNKRCYLAELWEHKINNGKIVDIFPYLFDHPFPNSFYGSDFLKHFVNGIGDFISVEAIIVSQSDEIAQRQQDLEDAVSAGLISFEKARDEVYDLINEKKDAANQKVLGELVVKFYSDRLIETTKKKFAKFVIPKTKPKINFYYLINLLYQLSGDRKKRNQWIINELNTKQSDVSGKREKINFARNFFEIDYDDNCFYSVVHDFLNGELKSGRYNKCLKILKQFELLFDKVGIKKTENIIERIDYLKSAPYDVIDLKDLDLYPFYLLFQIYSKLPQHTDIIDDLKTLNSRVKPKELSEYKKEEVFGVWRRTLGAQANSVLSNLVILTEDKKLNERFNKFKESQKNYILKNELVEKNDGKANYILKRLFSAFTTNSHQLPDTSLDFILIALSINRIKKEFFKNELITFNKILETLKKTSINGFDDIMKSMDRYLIRIEEDSFNIKSSNEIKALCEKRKDLFDFFNYFESVAENLKILVRSEDPKNKNALEIARRKLRGILDNPILNAMPYWKSLLTRGICDYIASLTDQEAIEQYEKLYASAMDLI